MSSENYSKLGKVQLTVAIPSDRYWLSDGQSALPRAGDVVVLDQGSENADGRPMILVCCLDDSGSPVYEALVYESELGPNIIGSDLM